MVHQKRGIPATRFGAENVPSRRWCHWTAEEKRLLRELLAEGASTREAAEELERSWRAVQCMATLLGIKRGIGRGPDPIKRGRVLSLLSDGMNMVAIAHVLGRCHSTITRMIQQMEREGLVRRVGTVSRNVRYIPCSDEEILCQQRRSRSPCRNAS